jgi:hypothetical protein
LVWLIAYLLATKSIYAMDFVSPIFFPKKSREIEKSLVLSRFAGENNLQNVQTFAGFM